jgi:hypothetical protein
MESTRARGVLRRRKTARVDRCLAAARLHGERVCACATFYRCFTSLRSSRVKMCEPQTQSAVAHGHDAVPVVSRLATQPVVPCDYTRAAELAWRRPPRPRVGTTTDPIASPVLPGVRAAAVERGGIARRLWRIGCRSTGDGAMPIDGLMQHNLTTVRKAKGAAAGAWTRRRGSDFALRSVVGRGPSGPHDLDHVAVPFRPSTVRPVSGWPQRAGRRSAFAFRSYYFLTGGLL